MVLTRTVKLKLQADTTSIKSLIDAYAQAINYICAVGWKDNDCNGVSLHHKTYQHCKQWLPTALVISARLKAAAMLKSVFALRKRGKKVSCPQAKKPSILYNAISYNVWLDRNELSLLTLAGRQKIKFSIPNYFKQYLTWRRKSAELLIRKNKVYLNIVFEKEVTDAQLTSNVVGVDRGIKKLAVTSERQFYGGGKVRRVTDRYQKLRAALQSKGTRSAKRHLRQISAKENRFRRDVNHCISKKIANSAEPGTTFVLEDLKGIREASKTFRKKTRYWINSWCFYQLEQFLTYKAETRGCCVDFVDARYTSQKCSVCGHTERANRQHQSIFKCKKCGFTLNADLNAARNIKQNYQNAKCHSGRAAVNQPIVSSEVGCDSLDASLWPCALGS